MPVVIDTDDQILSERLLGKPEFAEADPAFKELALATFRTENSIGSLIHRSTVSNLPDQADDSNFNPWDHFSPDEQADERFVNNAMMADNLEEIEAVRQLSRKERSARDTIARGGAMSFVTGFGIGGVMEPINLIPVGGAAVQSYKAGGSILKAGMVTGSVAAGSTALQEMALHSTQLERTYGESAINVSAAFLLGGALGMGAEQLAKRGINKVELDDIESSMNIGPVENRSASAAETNQGFDIKGKVAKALAKSIGFDPLSRTVSSEMPQTRKISNMLAENPYEGERGNITAVESFAKVSIDQKYTAALEVHDKSFIDLRKRMGNDNLKDKLTRKGITRKKFNELVDREAKNPSDKAHPEVKAAAAEWRTKVYNPVRKELIEQKLLDEDVNITTADNYINRIWNKQKVAANMPKFLETVSKWLEEQDINLHTTAKQASIEIKTATGARVAELDKLLQRSEFKKGLDLEKQDYEHVAQQIAQRLLGTPDGMLPYDFKLGEGSKRGNMSGTSLRGPLKARVFNIPDELIEDFIERDIEVVASRYLKQTIPDIELSKAFDGDVDMKAAMEEIQAGYTDKIKSAKTEKERIKLDNERKADLRDIAGMRDRIRGVYDQQDETVFTRIMRTTRDLNYLRFMGGVVASSIPDVARNFMAEGFVKTFKNGFGPLIANNKRFKIAAAEGKRYGIGVNGLMRRSDLMGDIADYSQGGTKFERGVRSMAQSFGQINLMDKWTVAMKQLHLVTMQTSVIDGLIKGKYDRRLGRLGIDEANAKNIADEIRKYGRLEEGVWTSGAKNWDSPELERIWGAALRKESDRVIVMPGQEKPLFMSREMGKSVMQFRSFMYASTQRMLIAGIQGQDANYLGGTLASMALGMMAYSFKQWDANRDLSDDPMVWAMEGLDRSGSLGILMELNNTVEKLSNNSYGLRPILGASSPASRYASRSQLESFLGPTFGSFAETVLKVVGAGAQDREWTEQDTRALRRLLPYQNLMLFRQLIDKLEGKN